MANGNPLARAAAQGHRYAQAAQQESQFQRAQVHQSLGQAAGLAQRESEFGRSMEERQRQFNYTQGLRQAQVEEQIRAAHLENAEREKQARTFNERWEMKQKEFALRQQLVQTQIAESEARVLKAQNQVKLEAIGGTEMSKSSWDEVIPLGDGRYMRHVPTGQGNIGRREVVGEEHEAVQAWKRKVGLTPRERTPGETISFMNHLKSIIGSDLTSDEERERAIRRLEQMQRDFLGEEAVPSEEASAQEPKPRGAQPTAQIRQALQRMDSLQRMVQRELGVSSGSLNQTVEDWVSAELRSNPDIDIEAAISGFLSYLRESHQRGKRR